MPLFVITGGIGAGTRTVPDYPRWLAMPTLDRYHLAHPQYLQDGTG